MFSNILFCNPFQIKLASYMIILQMISATKQLSFQQTHKMSNFYHTNTWNTVYCHSVTRSDKHQAFHEAHNKVLVYIPPT